VLPFLLPLIAYAEAEVIPDPVPQAAFAESSQEIKLFVRNPGKNPTEANLRFRLYQVSSSTLMPVGDIQEFKKLQILPSQTLLDCATVKFPSVKTASRFQVQWLDGDRKAGRTDVIVQPRDILKQLKTLAGEKPLGILDAGGELRKVLDELKVEYEDLEKDPGLAGFKGSLAIVTAFPNREKLPVKLVEHIAAQAKAGTAIVWVLPPDMPLPSGRLPAYGLQLGSGAVVMAQPFALLDFAKSASAQASLLHFTQMAVKPEELPVPTTP
jgi:hypothetical protein